MAEDSNFRFDIHKVLVDKLGEDKVPDSATFNNLLDNNKDFIIDIHNTLIDKLGEDKVPDFNQFNSLLKKKGGTTDPTFFSKSNSQSSGVLKSQSPSITNQFIPEQLGGTGDKTTDTDGLYDKKLDIPIGNISISGSKPASKLSGVDHLERDHLLAQPKTNEENQAEIKKGFENDPNGEQVYRDMLNAQSQSVLSDADKHELKLVEQLKKFDNQDLTDPKIYNDYLLTTNEYNQILRSKNIEADQYIDKLKTQVDDINKASSWTYSDEYKKKAIKSLNDLILSIEEGKKPFFEKIAEKQQEITDQAISEGKDPQVLMQELLQGKMQEYNNLISQTDEEKYQGFGGLLNILKDIVGLTSDEKESRLNQLRNEIKILSPIAHMNRQPKVYKDLPGETFLKHAIPGSIMENEFLTQQQKASVVKNAIQETGTNSNINKIVLGKIGEVSKEPGLKDLSFYEGMAGDMTDMIIPSMVGAGIIGAASKIPRIAKAVNTVNTAIELTKFRKPYNVLKPGIERGLEYATASSIFKSEKIQDEFSFAAGLGAGVFGNSFTKIISKVGEKSMPALNKVFKLAGEAVGQAAEENAEDFGNILTRYMSSGDFNNAMKELDENFGSWDVNLKRTIGAFMFSLATQAGSNIGKGISEEAMVAYNNLSTSDKKKADDFLATIEKKIDANDFIQTKPEDVKTEILPILEEAKTEEIAKITSDESKLPEEKAAEIKKVEEAYSQKINEIVTVVQAKEQTNETHSDEDRIAMTSVIVGKQDIDNNIKKFEERIPNNPEELRLKTDELLSEKRELDNISKEIYLQNDQLPVDQIKLNEIISKLGTKEPNDKISLSEFHQIRKNLDEAGFKTDDILPANKPYKTYQEIKDILKPINKDIKDGKQGLPKADVNNPINEDEQSVDTSIQQGSGGGNNNNNTNDNNTSSEDPDQIEIWNKSLLTGEKVLSQRKGRSDEVLVDGVSSENMKKVVDEIMSKGLDFAKSLVLNTKNGLKDNIRANVATSIYTNMMINAKGDQAIINEAKEFDIMSAEYGSVAAKDLALTTYKSLRDQLAVLIGTYNNKSNATLNNKGKSGKSVQEDFDETTTSIQDELKKIFDKYSNTPEFNKMIEDLVKAEVKKQQSKPETTASKKQDIKKRRSAAIDKLKKSFSALSASGLTAVGIEAVGELAKTYVDEGVIQIAELVKKVKAEVKKALNGYELTKEDLDKVFGESVMRQFLPNYNIWAKEKQDIVDKLSKILSYANIDGKGNKEDERSNLERFADELYKNITKGFNTGKKGSGVSKEAIQDFLGNLEKYQEVLELTRQETFLDNEALPVEIKDVLDAKFFNDVIRKEATEANIKDIIKTHFSNLDKLSTTLYEKLTEGLSIDEKTAKEISDHINEQIKKQAKEITDKRIEALIKIHNRSISDAKNLAKRITELYNIGAFNSDAFNKAYYEVYGIDKLTQTDIDTLNKLILISESTFGKEKERYTQQFYDYFNRLDKRKKPKIAMFLSESVYNAMLSRLSTIITAVAGGTLTGLNWAKNRIIQNPKGTVFLMKNPDLFVKLDNPLSITRDIVMDGVTDAAFKEAFLNKQGFFETLYNKKWSDPFKRRAIFQILMLPIAKVTVFTKRLLAAQNAIFTTPIAEVDYALQAYNAIVDQNKDLKKVYEGNKKALKNANPENKQEAQTNLDDSKKAYEESLNQEGFLKRVRDLMKTSLSDMIIAEEQYNKEQELLKEKGIYDDVIKKRRKNYKKNRISAIIYEKRNQDLLDIALFSADQAQLMNSPEGELIGRFIDVFGRTRINENDSEGKALGKLALRISTFPFSTVMFNLIQMATESTPIGIIKSLRPTTYVSGRKSRGLNPNVEKTKQQILDQRTNGIVGSITMGALFAFMFEWDDEEKKWKKRNNGFGLTGSGHGVNYDSYTKNQEIDQGTYQDHSLYYYDGKRRVNYSYKDHPLGFGLAFLGEFMDELEIRNPERRLMHKEEEYGWGVLNNSMFGAMNFATSQSYAKSIRDLQLLLAASDAMQFKDRFTKFSGQKVNTFLVVGAWDQISDFHNWYAQNPEKRKDGFFDYAFNDVPFFQNYLDGTKIDRYGLPIIRKYSIPLIPNAIGADMAENKDARVGNKYWELTWKYQDMSPRYPKLSMSITKSSNGLELDDLSDDELDELDQDFAGDYTVKKIIKFKNRNADMFEQIFAEANTKYIDEMYDELNKMNPWDLKKELSDISSDAAKDAREKMFEYMKNNKEAFEAEQ